MLPVFTNIALLAGLAGIAAPVLIHLLLRRRSQRMRFSTVQFFVKTDERSMRKRKLRNLLLLSLRVLIFLLLVLAFARPYLPNRAAGVNAGRRQQAILMLDTSASMQAGAQWTRAREQAQTVLRQLRNDDRAALVLASGRSSVASGFVPPSVLARKLEDIPPGAGTADLSEGLRQVTKVFTTADPGAETSLHVLSDLQRAGVQNLPSAPLPRELKVKTADLGERFIPNVAVTALSLERHEDAPPHAGITSFSDENYPALAYRLRIDGKEILNGTCALAAGANTNLSLAIPALSPGWHSAEFSVEAKDGLMLDNTRYATILVPDPIQCLVVEPRPAEAPYLQESFFVAAALDPVPAGEASPSRFRALKSSAADLAAELQARPGRANARLVVLPGVHDIPPQAAAALQHFVESGGGLLLFLGEEVSANVYNSQLGTLLPAELDRIEPARESAYHFGSFESRSPVFSLFAERKNGNLKLHDFLQRFALTPKTNAQVLARFEDGAPLVVERQVGSGHVLLVNSSADTRWTDWQKHKSFVPWLHSAAFYLAGVVSNPARDDATAILSGTEIDLPLGMKRQNVKVQTPGGAESALTTDEDGTLRDVPVQRPGVYSVTAADREVRRFAANVPAVESDLAMISPSEFEQQLVRQNEPNENRFAAGLFTESPRGRELWRLLLFGALIFLLVEPVVANRTAG